MRQFMVERLARDNLIVSAVGDSTPAQLGKRLDQVFATAGLPPPSIPMVECETFSGIVAVLARTDMLALLTDTLLTMPIAHDVLQEIPVTERLPSPTHGICARACVRAWEINRSI